MKDGTDFSTLTIASGNMMSETNTFQADSGSTDEPARKADVMPTASDIGAAVRSRAMQRLEAEGRMLRWAEGGNYESAKHGCMVRISAFREVLHWIADLEADAAISTREEGIPTS